IVLIERRGQIARVAPQTELVLQRDEGDPGARQRTAGRRIARLVVLLDLPPDLARIGVVGAAVGDGGDADGDAGVGSAHPRQQVTRESRDAVFARGEGTHHAEGEPRHWCSLSRPTDAQLSYHSHIITVVKIFASSVSTYVCSGVSSCPGAWPPSMAR